MITIQLDLTSTSPLYEQIYNHIKNEIKNNKLAYDSKLPSTRNLANHLQVSRNTIDMAYDQLLAEGYIKSIAKKGYYICQISMLKNMGTEEKKVTSIKQPLPPTYKYDFSPFTIDLNSFPYHTWRKLSNNILNTNNNSLFLLGNNQGDEPLRNAIMNYLHQSRGVNCSNEQIIIGAGADYLLQLLSQLIENDSIIAMENPTYKKAYHIFTGLNFTTRPISLDKSGMNIIELEQSDANLAYVTPSHQYPLGVVMPIKRRLELLNWANKNKNRYIVEDDHDSEFRYKGKPIPALQGMDNNGKVVYIGTFSRAIAPGIRIGYMVLPYSLLKKYQDNLHHYSSTVSRIDQSILTSFIDGGYFERHLNKMRKLYKNKHDYLINSLKIFENNIELLGENAGLYLIIKIKLNICEKELIALAANYSIKLYGLTEHYITKDENQNPKDIMILLGYADLSEIEIKEGISQLYQLIISLV